MNIKRIKSILLHDWYHFTHTKETWVDLFWNSAIQMAVFILIAQSFSGGNNGQAGVNIVAGMILWNVIWIGQYALTVGALWEIWSDSFSSLFTSPLKLEEFLAGEMLSGTIKALAAVAMSDLISLWLFKFSITTLGWINIVYFFELIIFSWGIGMMVLSLIFRYGTDIQSLSWSLVFLVQPLGAVFYPLSILPRVVQIIAYGFPATYIFEAMREQIATGNINYQMIGLATITNIVWFILGYLIINKAHIDAKISGAFARIEG